MSYHEQLNHYLKEYQITVKELAEAVLQIFRDASLRERLESGAYRKVKEFTVSRMGERIYFVYNAILQHDANLPACG